MAGNAYWLTNVLMAQTVAPCLTKNKPMMKANTFKPIHLLLIFSVLMLASCKKDKCEQKVTYTTYDPVYMSYAELRSAVKSESPRSLNKPGKIYLKGNYIFVSEVDKGIHIIDNTNPSAPQNIAFINIPGNMDLAAVGNNLYADSYIDLVVLDISNPMNVSVSKRVENALPYRQYTNGYYADPQKGIATDWTPRQVTEVVSNNCGTGGGYWGGPIMFEGDMFNNNTAGTGAVGVKSNPNVPGIGGSTARFTIASNALYIVDDRDLHVYDISSPTNPVNTGIKNIAWNIETIFPYGNHLFIGGNNGVYIYDNSNPLNPVYVSQYNHVTACDPVVVEDQYAYFTLNNLVPCQQGVNELQVVDLSNIAQPTLKTTMPMTSPRGVGIDNKTLFVCDGNDGLKVYNASDVMQIGNNQVAHFSNIQATDVIPYNNRLLMIGEDGLYQYDYSNIQNITQLSRIPVVK